MRARAELQLWAARIRLLSTQCHAHSSPGIAHQQRRRQRHHLPGIRFDLVIITVREQTTSNLTWELRRFLTSPLRLVSVSFCFPSFGDICVPKGTTSVPGEQYNGAWKSQTSQTEAAVACGMSIRHTIEFLRSALTRSGRADTSIQLACRRLTAAHCAALVTTRRTMPARRDETRRSPGATFDSSMNFPRNKNKNKNNKNNKKNYNKLWMAAWVRVQAMSMWVRVLTKAASGSIVLVQTVKVKDQATSWVNYTRQAPLPPLLPSTPHSLLALLSKSRKCSSSARRTVGHLARKKSSKKKNRNSKTIERIAGLLRRGARDN